jgi:heptosyltransferase-1
MVPEQPQRVLIVRLSAIGDVVFASPLIGALQRTWPGVVVDWLVEPQAAPLLQHHSGLGRVVVWPKKQWLERWQKRQWRGLWADIRAFREHLREVEYDVVLDVQGLLKSSVLTRLAKAQRRIGLDSGERTHWLLDEVYPKSPDVSRIGSEYFGLAQQLGLAVDDFAMDIALSSEARQRAQALAAEGAYWVVCPFTTRPQKHWREGAWVMFIEQQHALGRRIVVLGGPGDIAAAQPFINAGATSLVGELSLLESAAVISEAQGLVGVDTGLTHMGIAFGIPTVAIFGSTCPYTDTTRANARVIFSQLDCAPCGRRPTCGGRFDCMVAISVEQVTEALEQVSAV